jgi:hypothetical protein
MHQATVAPIWRQADPHAVLAGRSLFQPATRTPTHHTHLLRSMFPSSISTSIPSISSMSSAPSSPACCPRATSPHPHPTNPHNLSDLLCSTFPFQFTYTHIHTYSRCSAKPHTHPPPTHPTHLLASFQQRTYLLCSMFPSLSAMSRPCRNTPGNVTPRRGSTSGTHGPRALPVATINCSKQGRKGWEEFGAVSTPVEGDTLIAKKSPPPTPTHTRQTQATASDAPPDHRPYSRPLTGTPASAAPLTAASIPGINLMNCCRHLPLRM